MGPRLKKLNFDLIFDHSLEAAALILVFVHVVTFYSSHECIAQFFVFSKLVLEFIADLVFVLAHVFVSLSCFWICFSEQLDLVYL
jgi:hypothetical protein